MADLMGQNRQKKFVIARHIAMFLSKEVLNLNIMQISDAFGKKGHTTALHAISKIKEMMEQELEMKQIIEQIRINLIQPAQK
jgi:chromosomal replication initiator protein